MIAMLAALPGFAIDYWTIGKVQAVLSGGEETTQAGYVYVSAEAIEDASAIVGVDSLMLTDPVKLSGSAGSSAINKVYYFYAKANAGYTFVGFAATATGTPSGSGLADAMATVGDYYTYSAKAGAGWSGNTSETAKVLTRYAVFEKTDDIGGGEEDDTNYEDTATEAKVVSVTNQHGKNLIDAVLTVNDGEDLESGDIVTHIYVTFDHELKDITTMAAHKELASKVSIVNTTEEMNLEFNQYSCDVKGNDKHILDLFLSTDSYINSSSFQGVYVVTLPAGLATTTNNLPTEAFTFTFTYGGEETDGLTPVNFDDYLGNWKQKIPVGEEVENPAAFSFEKIGDSYYMTNLYATSLQIPISFEKGLYYFANTANDDYSFESVNGNSVKAMFSEQDGKKEIYLDQFSVQSVVFKNPISNGVCYFEYTEDSIPTAILGTNSQHGMQKVFDLQGRNMSAPVKGVNIVNGKKYLVK